VQQIKVPNAGLAASVHFSPDDDGLILPIPRPATPQPLARQRESATAHELAFHKKDRDRSCLFGLAFCESSENFLANLICLQVHKCRLLEIWHWALQQGQDRPS
jgi:hypothetical protein